MRTKSIITNAHTHSYRLWLCIMVAIFPGVQISASEHDISTVQDVSQQVVSYTAEFFTRYQPNTALDMVRQLPGFQLDDGDGTRGFASSVGNLLINGRRPSAKQDLPSATLARIPANQVERIELIRGQAQGIDLQGQAVLANVYLRTDIPATYRWELWALHNKAAPFKSGGSISMSDRWGGIDFNTGIDMERDTSGWQGTESRYDGNRMLLETGPTNSTEKGFRLNSLSLNASSWFGDNFVQLNSRLTVNKSTYERPSSSVSLLQDNRMRDVFVETTNKNLEYELGGDVERSISDNLMGKLILLYIDRDQNSASVQENIDSLQGRTLFRLADTDTFRKEQITRLEFDWAGFMDHAVQFNVERAYNVLDRGLIQTDDRGAGPTLVDVPGANSRVEEVRWDLLLQDTWSLGNFNLDIGTGAEASTLSQTGDAELERNFFFLKPFAVLGYSAGQDKQTRLRVARDVSQLVLGDFVSAIVLEDDEVARGNPNIRPETTWIAEISYEQRFGRQSLIKLTGFHHWISDVLDLLPLTSRIEVPGNIGDGRRWGLRLESSFPLEWLGLQGAKIDIRTLLQDSSVTDPVTGLKRRLSGDGGGTGYRVLETLNKNIEYHVRVDYRQDFEQARVAWGWTVADRGDRPLFRVNELDVYNEGAAVNIFVETTRWFGLKIRVLAENVLSYRQNRERIQFAGERDLSAVNSIIVRDRRHDISRIGLYLNGNF
jgi:hypothetical protein